MTGPANDPSAVKRSHGEFEELFMPHFDAAFNLARWLTRDHSDAEDVVQEAFMRAFKFFDGFHGGDSRSWILRIVRNTCFSWLQKNRPRELIYDIDERICDEKIASPETQLIENFERQRLRRQIEELPAPFKEVIVLRDIEGLSYKEIAAVIELPIGTVMSRLARGTERLQASLGVVAAGGQI
jgi:RNA polymerase sigma-70 factor (ECF subfamily)